jgi:hypothetical protein
MNRQSELGDIPRTIYLFHDDLPGPSGDIDIGPGECTSSEAPLAWRKAEGWGDSKVLAWYSPFLADSRVAALGCYLTDRCRQGDIGWEQGPRWRGNQLGGSITSTRDG